MNVKLKLDKSERGPVVVVVGGGQVLSVQFNKGIGDAGSTADLRML